MSTDELMAKWVRREAVKAENLERLKEMKEHGGIPHDEMMNWLGPINRNAAIRAALEIRQQTNILIENPDIGTSLEYRSQYTGIERSVAGSV